MNRVSTDIFHRQRMELHYATQRTVRQRECVILRRSVLSDIRYHGQLVCHRRYTAWGDHKRISPNKPVQLPYSCVGTLNDVYVASVLE